MGTTEQNMSQDPENDQRSTGADRPEGTVDEDANAPLTDMTDIDRDPDTVPPQDTGSAVPPYEGRQQSSGEEGSAYPDNDVSQTTGTGGQTVADHGSGHEHDDHGVGPAHTPGTGRAEDK